jgi:tetratricopeptide (TPR) repeat protein
MKRIGLLLVLIFSLSFAFGQTREVISCFNYLKEDILDDALTSISKASENQKTKDSYKTWWYFGQTYQAIAKTDNKKYKKLCEEPLDKAFDAYIKSINLNFIDPELKNLDLEKELDVMKFFKALNDDDVKLEDQTALYDIITVRLPNLANDFVNQGVEAFKTKEYETALAKFEKSITISTLSMKVDTQVMYFASLAANNCKDWEKLVIYNEVLKQMNYGAESKDKIAIYQNLAKGYINTGDTVKFVSTLKDGIEKLPEDSYALVIDLFNYYIDLGESAKALEYISLAIKSDDSNAQLFVVRGTLYEEQKEKENAKADYEKAIELDPANFDANYSLGAYYYNYAADTLDWANNNIPPTESQKYADVKKSADKLFAKALPFLEKAHEVNAKEISVLSTLKTIYYRLGDMDNHDAIKAELDALTE